MLPIDPGVSHLDNKNRGGFSPGIGYPWVTLLNWQPVMQLHRRLYRIETFEVKFKLFCLFFTLPGLFLPKIWLKTYRKRTLVWSIIISKYLIDLNWRMECKVAKSRSKSAKTDDFWQKICIILAFLMVPNFLGFGN